MNLKLEDSSIAQIAKVLQIAILTGTDVVDHLRQIEFESKDGKLKIAEEYLQTFKVNLEKMMSTLQKESQPKSIFD